MRVAFFLQAPDVSPFSLVSTYEVSFLDQWSLFIFLPDHIDLHLAKPHPAVRPARFGTIGGVDDVKGSSEAAS